MKRLQPARRRRIVVLASLTAFSCGKDTASNETSLSTLGGDATDGAGDSGTSAESETETETSTGDGPRLDMEIFPDLPVGDPCEEAMMDQANQGCEFWAADLPNVWAGSNGNTAPQDHQFAVVVANTAVDTDVNVDLFRGDEAMPILSAVIGVDQVHTFELPPASIEPRANSYAFTAFRIESDAPVTAYQFNPLDNLEPVYSNDASLLFPTHVLGTDYIAVTGDGILLSTDADPFGDNSGAFVSVVGTQDGTIVDIYPPITATLYPGITQGITLDRGQVATVISDGTGENLSGTRVLSNAPVAVFSGNVATIEPNPGPCCADHLEHAMLPLTAWGTGYAAAPPANPLSASSTDPCAYRITGAFDGTQLVYDPAPPPGAPTTINSLQTVRFETDLAFTIESADPDKPFNITQFLLSNQAINAGGQSGDPAMIALPAAEQYQDEYVFLVPDGYSNNFVTVIAPSGTTLELDGNAVGGSWITVGALGGTNWEYKRRPLGAGAHKISADNAFGIVSIGYADDVSYGFPGGSGVAIISIPPPLP